MAVRGHSANAFGRGRTRGGLGAGAAVGLYFAVKLLSGVARGAPDAMPDHLAAAVATGAACGLLGKPLSLALMCLL